MHEVPLVQAGFLSPIVEELDRSGVNTAALLQSASLHRFNMSKSDNYVPVELMYRLFESIRRREGIDDFMHTFGDSIKAQGMCDWCDVVANSPDLHSAINFAIRFESVLMTHQRMHLEINGPVSRFSQRYLDNSQPGRDLTDFVDFCLAINFFKHVGGADWQPLEISLQSSVAPNFDQLLPMSGDTKIILGQPVTSLVFPTAMLSAPLAGTVSALASHAFEDVPHSLSGVIDKLLQSANDGRIAKLGLVADMLNMSPRTLRRRLVTEGTTFSSVVESWRFKSSIDLIENADTKVGEIAERLGYANAPNFDRAFKRWTGLSPGAYREALI